MIFNRRDKLPECPRCDDTEKIHRIGRFITDDDIQDQWICGSCGNVFREILHFEGWLLD